MLESKFNFDILYKLKGDQLFLVSEELSTEISRGNIECGSEPINIEECRMSSQNL